MPDISPPADGVVTFAFRLPLQPVAADNAATLSVLFLLVNEPTVSPTTP